MRVLALVYETDAGGGVVLEEIAARGHEIEEWQPAQGPLQRPLAEYDALVAFGGGMQADEDEAYPWLLGVLDVLRGALAAELPTLGICLGAQALARAAGGTVGPAPRAEWGWQTVALAPEAASDPLLGGLPDELEVLQWHTYAFVPPAAAVTLARSPVCVQAMRIGPSAWGLQWHPEVTAETVLLWGARYPPELNGESVEVDLQALRADVDARIADTNADGRALCARFLDVAARRRA